MHIFKYIVKFLVVIGALDVGGIGLFGFCPIASLFSGMMMYPPMIPMGAKVTFIVIGIAGILSLICLLQHCFGCKDGNKKDKGGGCCR
jgi:uncharacterized membrane protein YuzA (DUF378 family)